MADSTTDSDGSAPSRPGRIQYHRPGPDLAAAMECELCTAQGISNPPGWNPRLRPPRKRRTAEEASPKKRTLPISPEQSRFLQRVWDRVAEDRAGNEPESRMLAVAVGLRAAVRGRANMLAHDMKILRIENPESALSPLTSSGWLESTPERILAAGPESPETCDIPSFQGNPWQVGEGVRSRASGWFTQTISHRKMRKKPARLRLLGAYLASHSDLQGRISLPAEQAVRACALSGPAELAELLEWLVRIEWITRPDLTRDPVDVELTEVTAALAPTPPPPPTPPKSAPASTPLDRPAQERAQTLVLGREAQVAQWVGAFRQEHGHGPSWSMICDEFGWPARRAPDHDVTELVFRHLREHEWLTGFGAPFALRPGPRSGEGDGEEPQG